MEMQIESRTVPHDTGIQGPVYQQLSAIYVHHMYMHMEEELCYSKAVDRICMMRIYQDVLMNVEQKRTE